jgi:hypothetical protein
MRGTSGVHRGRWRSVALVAGCGPARLAGNAVRLRLRFARAARRAPGPPADSGGTASRRLKPGAGEEAGMWTWCDREDRFRRASLSLGRKSVAGPARLSCRRDAAIGCGRPAGLSDCPAEAGDGRVAAGEWGAAGFSWMSWDMIQNVRRADQAHSGATDATRTAGVFHAHGNGVSAGQWLFRWAGMGSL